MYYYQASRIAQLNVEIYVDLFLLWLLYRFMKPQKIFENGKTEASTLLFAHDGKRATEILRQSYFDDEETRHTEIMDKKHKEFIDFVIKDLANEIATESAVTLEFMDQSERDSFTSSVCNYAEIEEISDGMQEEYISDADKIRHDLEASHITVSTENLTHK